MYLIDKYFLVLLLSLVSFNLVSLISNLLENI